MHSDDARAGPSGPSLAIVVALLALLCAALYVRALPAPFASGDLAAGGPRPVTELSFTLNDRFTRGEPWGHRATNVAIHAAVGALVCALGAALLQRRAVTHGGVPAPRDAGGWAALAGAAIFAAHPLQVESVTGVAQRASALAALFGLASLLLWMRARAAEGRARLALGAGSALCWLLAVASRETALALPVAIWLCEWIFAAPIARRSAVRRLAVAVALSAGAAALWLAAGGLEDLAHPRYTLAERLLAQPRAIALYESLAVLPLPSRLSVAHELAPPRSLVDPPITALLLAAHAALLAAAVAVARRWPVASFAVLWWYLWIAVEAIPPALTLAAEHRAYLALAGPSLAAGHLLFSAPGRHKGPAAAIAVLAVVALGAATRARNEVWRSPDSLWADAAAKSPGDPTARLERGLSHLRAGRLAEAESDLVAAVGADPRSARARVELAVLLAWEGRPREALAHAEAAVALDPTRAAAHAALAGSHAALGDHRAAVAAYQRALALEPAPWFERRLGDSLQALGRYEEAILHYHRALERNPGDDDARLGAGAALVELGRLDEALDYLLHAVESQPNPRYLAHWGDALWRIENFARAIDAVTTAVRLQPDWPGGALRLAWMLAVVPDPALRDPERALRIADVAREQAGADDPRVADARAAALAGAGRFGEARGEAERAAALARDAGDAPLADAIGAHALAYARGEVWRDPPRPFDPSR